MKIAAIARAPENSPGMVDKDRAILCATAEALRQKGDTVTIMKEDEYTGETAYDAILHMTRNNKTLSLLAQAESQGTLVTNSPSSVCNCSRSKCMQMMQRQAIPLSPFATQSTDEIPPHDGYPMWIKRAEGWSCHPLDVCHVSNSIQAEEVLKAFKERGINNVIRCRHMQGDIVKFYGVSEEMFHWHYPDPEKTKFGLERINGTTAYHPFSTENLKEISFAAARALGVEIFGGDATVSPDGTINIIDLNDFPSFSACRAEAAEAIARLIHSKRYNKNNKDERSR